jgi:hypothetical protein
MVATVLIDQYIHAGRGLVEMLQQSEFPLQGAFWLYSSESDGWRLVLVTELVDALGTTEAYKRVQDVLDPNGGLTLSDVKVVGTSAPLASVLQKVHRRGPPTWMLDYSGPLTGGGWVDSALVYQLN